MIAQLPSFYAATCGRVKHYTHPYFTNQSEYWFCINPSIALGFVYFKRRIGAGGDDLPCYC